MKARVIFGTIIAAIAFVITSYTCYEWSCQGCAWWQLLAAITFYNICIVGFWYAIDSVIKDNMNN